MGGGVAKLQPSADVLSLGSGWVALGQIGSKLGEGVPDARSVPTEGISIELKPPLSCGTVQANHVLSSTSVNHRLLIN